MHPPHHALPWPAAEPDGLARTANDLRRLCEAIANEASSWRLEAVDWRGRSATAHADESDWIRSRAMSVPESPQRAATAILRLEEMVRSARHDIRRLAESVGAAEANARSQQATADRVGREAFLASTGAATLAESERLRQRAIVERNRAELASRAADLVLRRAIATASELVASVDRCDLLTAHQLDTLLTEPLAARGERPLASSHGPAHDGGRGWITRQIWRTREAIQHHVDALARSVDALEAIEWSERSWAESMALVHLSEELDVHRRFLTAERQMLAWDPSGDGRVVEVFGDLSTARHIAVLVPGIMNTLENFDDHLARDARNLWTEAATRDGRTAVIAWLGYDTPELLNAVSKGRAVEYESEFRSFVESLPAEAHVTVVAHSYGTVLTGEAAARGLAADDIVLVGSPGTRLDHADEANLETGAQVFAGVSDSDYVVGRTGYGSIVCPEKALGFGWLTGLRWVVSPITGPVSWVTDSCNTDADGDVKALSHGINPAHDDFGAVEISTEGVDGHSSYFEPDSSSLEAIAEIVTGSHPEQR